MQVAIVHYHLNRGGVTQVIVNQLRALACAVPEGQTMRVAILYGGRADGWPVDAVAGLDHVELTLHEIPELDYGAYSFAAEAVLADRIESGLVHAGFAASDTVVHVHNHALGKNSAIPGTLAQLADDGWPLLLQLHDFVEDYRPANYQVVIDAFANRGGACVDWLYPQGSAIHYAVLNGRDRQILQAVGIAPERLHWLPNPVGELGPLADRAAARRCLQRRFGVPHNDRYILYPVRGIRRKNLGELLLWAATASTNERLGITLAPMNPVEKPYYLAWKRLAHSLDLPVLFETGGPDGLTFLENLAASDQIITTSVAEGFGMVYLETWLFGRMLAGRDLPAITRDYTQQGVCLSNLYDELLVPVRWVGRSELDAQFHAIAQSAWQTYGRDVPTRAEVSRQLDSLLQDDCLDFARFPTQLQARIIALVSEHPRRRDELLHRNPSMLRPRVAVGAEAEEVIGANAAAVRRSYGVKAAGTRLRELYQKVLDSPRAERYRLPNGPTILDAFLALNGLYPVRVE